MIPETMEHVVVTAPGGPEVLRIGSAATPHPGAGEVLIRVAAAGVNRPDVLQRQGKYPPPPGASPILGLEVAGTIAACGANVTEWRVGDAVCALVAGGGYAEYCVAPAPQCLPIPAGCTMVEAAALPETVFTVWTNVFQRGRLVAGERILIHGGSSGIGTTAIQIAHARGARVFATAGTAEKCVACEGLGAEAAFNYRETDFVAEVERVTDGAGVDVVLDMVGGSYVARNLASLRTDGRLVQISFLEGSHVELELRTVMTKRLTITGSTLRPRSVAEKGALAREVLAHVWPLVAEGRVRPVIDGTYPLSAAAAAHRRMDSGEHIGKIVLTV
jgi:putative PIG3 family NAD(P)H quinone oxidoreductase